MKFSLVYSELSSQWKIVLDTKLYWVFSHIVLSELGVQGSDPFLSSQYRLISFTSLPLSSGSSLFCSRYWLPIMSFLMALLLQEFQSLTNTDRALPPSYRHLLVGRLSSFRHYFLVGWGKSDCRQRRQISLEKMILWLDTNIYWFIRSQLKCQTPISVMIWLTGNLQLSYSWLLRCNLLPGLPLVVVCLWAVFTQSKVLEERQKLLLSPNYTQVTVVRSDLLHLNCQYSASILQHFRRRFRTLRLLPLSKSYYWKSLKIK